MMKIFTLVVALLLSFVASAANYEVTVEHPTKFNDGSTIPATGPGSLTMFRAEAGTCNADGTFGAFLAQKTANMPANKVVVTNVSGNLVCFRAIWSNSFGQSAPSAVVAYGQTPAAGSIVIIKVAP